MSGPSLSSNSRDIIQISLGSSANAVTAHLLNLQGLGCTASSSSAEAVVCDPSTTHSLEKNHWVPRALLVDEPTRFFASSQVSSSKLQLQLEQQRQPFVLDSSLLLATDNQSVNSPAVLQHDQPDAWNDFLQSASILAYSSHSRYYQEPPEQPQRQHNYKASTDNPRHVVWDDDEEEENEEDPQERAFRLQREHQQWNRSTNEPLQEQLSTMAKANPVPTSWMEYLMPPYSERSKIPLPYSHQSHMVSHWDKYHNAVNPEWKEDVLLESVRHLLEDCDACQGVTITTQGHGVYAGLATTLLQEFQQECKSAGRMVMFVTNPESSKDQKHVSSDNADEIGWQPAHVERVRTHVSTGLAWHEFAQNAHTVLPLRLPTSDGSSLFHTSAKLALALEASTLPFRLSGRSRFRETKYSIGLQNAPFFGHGGGDDRWGTTAQRLNFGEYLAMLQPSPSYKVLELDVVEPGTISNADLYNKWKVGTSVERDQRMREPRNFDRRNQRNLPPGRWLQPIQMSGILSSRSLPHEAASSSSSLDRSAHYHYSLSTAVRPVLQDDLSQYLTCLVQGMGISYRPERSMCTVLDQTIGSLTDAGGGAGAYWSSLLQQPDTPVVAVLGNTSRPYAYLHQVTTDFKTTLGPRYRGYYQRDVMNAVLPELEDCEDALANHWDLVDLYHPPDGSGFGLAGDGDIDF